MSIPNIIGLLGFCLKNTCFLFWGKYYDQVQGTAMAFPKRRFVTNLFVEDFDIRAISNSFNLPRFWRRYVHDTFVIWKIGHRKLLLEHINWMDPHIKLATKETRPDGYMPFLIP